jgi:hypothetical protein
MRPKDGVLAAYWLGFFAPNPDAQKEAAEIEAFKRIAQTNAPDCEMMEHVIALKALGLRSAESVDYWKRLAQRTPNVWERHQIVINAYGRWGEKFLPAALELLKMDTAQYVQWELLNGNLEMRQGREYRNYWDIWIPADVLLVLQFDDAQWRPPMDTAQLDVMLDWLDAGARPRDPVVLNHMIFHLLAFSSGDDTRRLLRIFDKLPQRNENWWILQPLRDPTALPVLTYWSTLPAPPNQQEILKHLVENLSNEHAKRETKTKACCEATEACLIEQVKQNAPPATLVKYEIHSEEDARRWLNIGASHEPEIKVRYADDLKRAAIVRRPDGSEERWEYLYDCWREADAPAQDGPAH